jgi:hypothetical protein
MHLVFIADMLDIVKPSTLSEIPPWKLINPKVDILLSEFKKIETNSIIFKDKLSKIKQSKLPFIQMVQKTKTWLQLLQ